MSSHQLLLARLAKQKFDSITKEIGALNEKHTFVVTRNAHYCEQVCFQKLTDKYKEKLKIRQKICIKILDTLDEAIGLLFQKRHEQIKIYNDQKMQLEAIGINIQSIGLCESGGNLEPLPNNAKRNKEFETLIDNMAKDKNNLIEKEGFYESSDSENEEDEDEVCDYGELNKAFIS
jgi:hypothetical protein